MNEDSDRLELEYRRTVALEKMAEALKIISETKKVEFISWRNDPATAKQKALLFKNKIPFKEPITKGEASDLIDSYMSSKNRRV